MTYRFYQQLFESHGLELNPDIEAATTDQILPLVKSELGLAFMPEPMAEESIKNHRIIQFKLKENIPQRHVCLVYDSKHPLGAAAKELKSQITE